MVEPSGERGGLCRFPHYLLREMDRHDVGDVQNLLQRFILQEPKTLCEIADILIDHLWRANQRLSDELRASSAVAAPDPPQELR